ncbi:MAG: hypothetical protein QOD03_1515 [Verrucomicrobiota bacterium]|jgi:hypothetical protein
MGIFSFLLGGCNKSSPLVSKRTETIESIALHKSPEITSETEEGFQDLIFYIQEHKRLPDGTQKIQASGIYQGQVVGFEVLLNNEWREGSLGKGVPLVTYQGSVIYHSTGSESDGFLRVLNDLYGTKMSSLNMADETKFTGISLEGDPKELEKGPVKIKLFYELGGEKDYAELYTNIELGKRRLEVHEKDTEYRLAIVKALQQR